MQYETEHGVKLPTLGPSMENFDLGAELESAKFCKNLYSFWINDAFSVKRSEQLMCWGL